MYKSSNIKTFRSPTLFFVFYTTEYLSIISNLLFLRTSLQYIYCNSSVDVYQYKGVV